MRNKPAICLAAIALAAFAACADPTRGEAEPFCPESHFLHELIDGGDAVMITGYVGGRTDVRIPPYIQGLPVTAIGDRAFEGKWIWTEEPSFSPDGNGSGDGYWEGQLASVVIPNNVTSVGLLAFAGNQLINVFIPNSVTYIGELAFANNRLTSVTIGNGIVGISGGAFANNQIANITIPDSVIGIGSWAFRNNNLTSVNIPFSITYIGAFAFYRNQLTNVIIPNREVHVDEQAFDPWVAITMGTD